MKNKNEGILKILIALMLAVSSLFVMSSCMLIDLDSFFEDYLGDDDQTPNDGFRPPFLPDYDDPTYPENPDPNDPPFPTRMRTSPITPLRAVIPRMRLPLTRPCFPQL